MASYLAQLSDGYHDLIVNRRDARVDGWFLMSSPVPITVICVGYVLFAKWLGPRLMRHRPAYGLHKTMLLYNFIQVLASVYMVHKGWKHGWSRYSLRCQPTDYSTDNEDEVIVLHLCWWYFFNKLVELLDTAFFVLRKKFDQVSNLHVIHHCGMPFFVWWVVKFTGGGHPTLIGLINNFVHAVMYSYYFLAALGPQIHKYLWWKKYLTALQIAQFVIVFIHTAQLFFIECNVPKVMIVVFSFNTVVIFGLFANFYVQAYIKGRRISPNTGVKQDREHHEFKAKDETRPLTRSNKDEQHHAAVKRVLRFNMPEQPSRS